MSVIRSVIRVVLTAGDKNDLAVEARDVLDRIPFLTKSEDHGCNC